MNTQELEQSVNIGEYYYILAKHKWLIMTCFVIVAGITVFLLFGWYRYIRPVPQWLLKTSRPGLR